MLQEYGWTLWFLIPLSIPVMGLLYLAACALADRETSFPMALVLGSITFFTSFPLGWWLVWARWEGRNSETPKLASAPCTRWAWLAAFLASWLYWQRRRHAPRLPGGASSRGCRYPLLRCCCGCCWEP